VTLAPSELDHGDAVSASSLAAAGRVDPGALLPQIEAPLESTCRMYS
jgi:hypothetical protein